MRRWGQYDYPKFALDMIGVLRTAALDGQEGLAAKQDCVSQKPPVLIAEVAEFLLAETSCERTALYAGAIVEQAYLRMVGDFQKPLNVPRIAFRLCLHQTVI